MIFRKQRQFLKVLALFCVIGGSSGQAQAQSMKDRINQAQFSENGAFFRNDARNHKDIAAGPSPFIVRAQIALDRAGFSVGVIDGYNGENMSKAITAFQHRNGLPANGSLDRKVWTALESHASGPVTTYSLSEEDVATPIDGPIPDDYAKKAEMAKLGYTSVREMIAERFHMDQDLLEHLNPDADFSTAGTEIVVADSGADVTGRRVTHIRVDGTLGSLHAADYDGNLVAFYPATADSTENLSPSGTHEVRAVAPNPTYTYRLDVNFTQGDNTEALVLPAGPNGPVGSMWIDLSEPTYGIHGTPEPAMIDKTASHGCVRLTNWDAEELAGLIEQGTVVEFLAASP
jgi:lipoprotein-anchoring transpeptidase ErfK/SrfK